MEDSLEIGASHGGIDESHSSNPLIGQSTTSQPLEDGVVQVVESVVIEKNVSRKRSRSSNVWNHFTIELDKDTGVPYGTCKYCKVKRYDARPEIGTSNFIRHMKKCKEYMKENPCQSPTTTKQIDLKIFHELLAEMVLRHGYSFSFVEHEATRKLFKYLNDDVDTITRNTVKKICLKKHEDLKEKIMHVFKGLPGRISLTCDLWTACTGRGYLCVTAHYIDENWKLQSKVLCFRHCSPPHGGHELSIEMSSVIFEWGIQKKIFSLTVDNATNMDKMVNKLKDGAMLRDLICKGKYFHIRCCAHVLNLIVKNGLKVIDKSVAKVREGIKYIDGSEARFQKFYELAKRSPEVSFSGGLWLDVATRWNSTYIMLDRALKYRPVLDLYFDEMSIDSSKYQLQNEEWEKIENICQLLQPFYEITKLFSGSDYPTANLYLPQVFLIRTRLQKPLVDIDTPDDLEKAIYEMIQKFNKYWSDYVMVLAFAVVFDPRFKFKFVEFSFAGTYGKVEGEKMAKEVKLHLDELFKEYRILSGVQNSSNIEPSRGATQFHYNTIEEFALYDQFEHSKSELDIYLGEQRLMVKEEFDILNYWKENSIRFPVLSAMARDILAIPITSVASESTFSMGGRIVSKCRSALEDKNVDALVTTQNWLSGYDDFTLEGASLPLSSNN